MKQVLFNLLLAFFISGGVANAATNTLHDKPLKTAPTSTDETYVWDTGTSTLKKTTFAPFLVGDCTGFPCLDGTSDGGNYIKLWAGTGSYWTALQGGAPAANRSWRLPIAAPPSAGTTYLMNMDEYGQMGFVAPSSFLTPTGSGAALTIDASGFDGNLTTSDNTLQEVSQKVDDLVADGGGIAHATSDGAYYASRNGAWESLAGVFAQPLGTDDNYVTDAEKLKLGNLSGTNTGDQDLSGYALTSSVLSKTNTTAFTPSSDYHPSTKKYVDDSITASGGYTDEQAQDAAGAMFSGNTETGITVTYDDATGKVNFAVPTTLASFTDDATHRLVTDTEKSTWNAKQNTLVAGTDYLSPTGSAANLTSFPSSLATDTEVSTGYQPLDADLTDLADGSLTGSKVGTGVDGGNISTGTVADARIDAAIARDAEVTSAINALPTLVFGTGLTISTDTLSPVTDTISVTANTYQAYDADWLGITANGASLISAANYAAMRALLDLEAGTDFNAYDADLTTYAGITPSANAQSLLGAANYAAMRTLLDLEVGTDFNAYDADIADLADGSLTGSRVAGYAAATTSKATTYTIGTDSISESYGGTVYVTSATTITAPAVTAGMNFSVVTIGDIAVSLDVNAADKMILDGVTLADGDKATNSSKAGDTITCQYYSADEWYCWSGTVLGGHWTDGN